MVNPQLIQYVRAQRAAGVSKEEIIKALAGGGWTAADAQEAFAAIEGPPPAPVAPKPPPPAATVRPITPSPAQPRPAAAMAATSSMQQPISIRPQPAAVVQPRSVYTPQVARRRSRWPWVLLGLLIFFLLGIGAGAYLAVTNIWVNSMVSSLAGVEQPAEEDSMTQVANEGDTGGFLEVSPEPFDTFLPDEENSTSTPGTATTTATTSASTSTSTEQ